MVEPSRGVAVKSSCDEIAVILLSHDDNPSANKMLEKKVPRFYVPAKCHTKTLPTT